MHHHNLDLFYTRHSQLLHRRLATLSVQTVSKHLFNFATIKDLTKFKVFNDKFITCSQSEVAARFGAVGILTYDGRHPSNDTFPAQVCVRFPPHVFHRGFAFVGKVFDIQHAFVNSFKTGVVLSCSRSSSAMNNNTPPRKRRPLTNSPNVSKNFSLDPELDRRNMLPKLSESKNFASYFTLFSSDCTPISCRV